MINAYIFLDTNIMQQEVGAPNRLSGMAGVKPSPQLASRQRSMKRLLYFSMALVASAQDVVREDLYQMSLADLRNFMTRLTVVGKDNSKFLQAHTKRYTEALEEDINTGEHRENLDYYYLEIFEKALKLKGSQGVPYWNWTVYAEEPHLDPVFSNTLFGREFDDQGCPTGNFKAFYAHPGECIQRKDPVPYATQRDLIPKLMEMKTYAEAKGVLRAITQGIQTSFTRYPSKTLLPRDPLYYLLISFEFKLLHVWKDAHRFDIEDPQLDPAFTLTNKNVYGTTDA